MLEVLLWLCRRHLQLKLRVVLTARTARPTEVLDSSLLAAAMYPHMRHGFMAWEILQFL